MASSCSELQLYRAATFQRIYLLPPLPQREKNWPLAHERIAGRPCLLPLFPFGCLLKTRPPLAQDSKNRSLSTLPSNPRTYAPLWPRREKPVRPWPRTAKTGRFLRYLPTHVPTHPFGPREKNPSALGPGQQKQVAFCAATALS